MTKPMPYIMLSRGLSITIDNEAHVINDTHPNFNPIIKAIKAKQWPEIKNLISIPTAISVASKGVVSVKNGQVYHKGLPVHSYLATRILELMQQGFDITPWTNFMEKLYQNPDPFSITQAYSFLERAKLPLCPDGDFLGYKYVRDNYFDCHTGTFDNSVGNLVREDRALCDNNPNNHCSKGLHFAAKGYLPGHYGNGTGTRIVIVKVNPKNIVSVPNDHNCEKARSCEYLVVGEIDKDYTFADMETSTVLPSPLDKKGINKVNKTSKSKDTPSTLEQRVLKSSAETLRATAKNLGVSQAEIVNLAGKFYVINKRKGLALGDAIIYATKAGRHWAHTQNIHNLAKVEGE